MRVQGTASAAMQSGWHSGALLGTWVLVVSSLALSVCQARADQTVRGHPTDAN